LHGPTGRIQKQLVHVAPAPILPRLEGLDDGVIGAVEVLGSVLISGLIAAPYMPTGHAEAQMHPGIAYPEAVLAAVRAGCYFANLVEVGTNGRHEKLLSVYGA
jgi:hypothetical protein